ncbi:hypothetical protein HII31_09439 [Pseudocercospora fuligena]|uniref:J domain-containing protein n=1 Tax=Pseudocercospora fuligena TaxID=685502 RepID=A0A8H6RB08_9PEZI|nr:hypothetical protein HII31_09439 [Pseudocercospora fuligena]
MASHLADLTLQEVYTQVQQSTPCAVFALKPDYTPHDLKVAYRALALRLHPDKCGDDSLRDLHTALFKRVQDAYEQLLAKGPGSSVPTSPESSTVPEESGETSSEAISDDAEFASFETKPATCGWSAEDFKRYFRALDELRARDQAMWEEIERPTLPKRHTPCMSKKTAERVRRVRQERCAEHETFMMRHLLDMRLWDLAEARSKLRKRMASLHPKCEEEQSSSRSDIEQEWED